MNKVVTLATSALALVLSGAALAGGVDHMAPAAPAVAATATANWYVAAHGGYTMLTGKHEYAAGTKEKNTEDWKNGFNGGAAVGYEMKGALPIRMEVAGTYYSFAEKTAAEHGDMTLLTVMGNVFYDMNMGQLTPYLGVGAGYARVSTAVVSGGSKVNASGFGYQGMLGVMYHVNDNVSIDLGYKLAATTAKLKDGANSMKMGSSMFHSFNIGLHYDFV